MVLQKKLPLAFVLWLLSVHLVALRYLILSSLFDLVGAFVACLGDVRVFFLSIPTLSFLHSVF